MRVFLYGDVISNTGPANVNKELSKNKDIRINRIKNKFLKQLFNFNNIILSSTIVFSGVDRLTAFYVNLCSLLGKKIIYLMHGYIHFENEHNKLELCNSFLNSEDVLLAKSDLILPVSENFSKWFIGKKKNYKSKTHFLTNGIDNKISLIDSKIPRVNNSIIATGGNRNLKNNKKISDAVNSLNNGGTSCFLTIFGRVYSSNEKIIENQNVKYGGMIPQDELYQKLRESKLYVLNTTVESFSLSVIEALLCGCNILVSKNAGVCSILKLDENDVINDFNDTKEIARKIKYNLDNNNNNRILKSLDLMHYSWENVSKRLIEICKCIENNEDYRNIK